MLLTKLKNAILVNHPQHKSQALWSHSKPLAAEHLSAINYAGKTR